MKEQINNIPYTCRSNSEILDDLTYLIKRIVYNVICCGKIIVFGHHKKLKCNYIDIVEYLT